MILNTKSIRIEIFLTYAGLQKEGQGMRDALRELINGTNCVEPDIY